YVAISFDLKEKTFRHEITETYKANRPPAPEDLIAQVEPIKEFFQTIEVPEISVAGYEADDVLATLAEKFKDEFEIVMVTGDKDFCQLVDNKITIFDPKKEKRITPKEVEKQYGITAAQFVDYLALVGDSADNIPGVKGIGPKNAKKLLQEFGSLKQIFENLENISAKGIRQKLQENKDDAFMSRKLAKIITDVPLEKPEKDQLIWKEENLGKAVAYLDRYELQSIKKRLNKEFKEEFDFMDSPKEGIKFQTKLVNTKKAFEELMQIVKNKQMIALDTETTSIEPMKAELVGISLCWNTNTAYYISLAHNMAENLDLEYVIKSLKKTFLDKTILAHHLKYDYIVLKRHGWQIEGTCFDTMIADYLLNPNERHSLEECAEREFSYEMIPISKLIGSGKKQITFDNVEPQKAAEYSGEDVIITFKLYQKFSGQLQAKNLENLFKKIEIPLSFVLANMEEIGVYLNESILQEISKKNQKRIAEITQEIYDIAKKQFNLNSTQQLAQVLFEDMKIPPVKKTKTGYSTDISVLEKLAPKYKIARLLIEYRQLNKLQNTYILALPKLINSQTGRLHSSFNQTVASTGRLSSSNPNLQNIPVRSEMGKEIRKAFTTDKKDWLILAADYSQIELRLLAILSEDKKMITAFQNQQDIHKETAAIIFDIPKKEVSSDQRRYAKIINFGLLYGMGTNRISNELKIDRKKAQKFIKNYFNKFPTIKTFLEKIVQKAKNNGYASTIFDRKLPLPGLYSDNKRAVSEAERIATNMPIQGSAADIIKIAMISLHEKFKNRHDVNMLIQVHDELVFEVNKKNLKEIKEIIRSEMEAALPEKYAKKVPLLVDIGTGKNWFEAH
ncbi:MAG: DNA polymerase I, partial [Candidatus Cloacimonadota bacterium]|nr:DNA polymerase I [Candidatus Cloacimonadota bacterium]